MTADVWIGTSKHAASGLRADGGLNEAISEESAPRSEGVDIGGLCGMSWVRTAEAVIAELIGHKDEEVRFGGHFCVIGFVYCRIEGTLRCRLRALF